jgi:hypothetical protein
VGAALALAPAVTSAAGFATQAFPVPVQIEKGRVRSSMVLQFDIQRYGVPFDTFAAGVLDAPETAFRDFLTALRAGDAARLAAFRPGEPPTEVRRIVDNFRPGFAQPVPPQVVARIGVGDGQMFVWEWPRPGDPARMGLTVLGAAGAPRVEIVTSARALETLLLDVLQQEALHPQAYRPVELRGRVKHTFPLGAAGKPGAHAVVLAFDGQPLDVEVMGKDRVKAASLTTGAPAAASVFQSAYDGLADDDLERWLGAYTDLSREKLRTWAQGLKPAELNSFMAATVKPRRVRFLLDADPVELLFYTVEADPKLKYEYLLKTPGGYKLTNAYFEGFLDDVLRDNALFPTDLESFRKSVLAGSPK